MKISIGQFNNLKLNSQSFCGFEHKKSDAGNDVYEFNYPHNEKYQLRLEIFEVKKNEYGNYEVVKRVRNKKNNHESIPISKDGAAVNLKKEYGIAEGEAFAYRYNLLHENTDNYAVDAGETLDYDRSKVNIVTQRGSKLNKGGSMQLVIPDSHNVGWVYDKDGKPEHNDEIKAKALKSVKTFSNKFGGTLAGLEKKIDELKKHGYTRIVSTPIFTDDSLTAHGYWIKNAMQMSQSLGSLNNYASLQRKMFKADMNLVADAALVNEGLEGVHFKDVLKHGSESPFYGWFRASGLESGPLTMGIFSKNNHFIGHKVVNAPYDYVQDEKGKIKRERNYDYDQNKPTYVQIYDNRLVSDKQKNDKKNLIEAYDKLSTKNHMDINTHDDTVVNYSFEIKPELYDKNIEDLNKINAGKPLGEKIRLDKPMAARILTKSDNFQLDEKFEGGFETWDANPDIAKLNYVLSDADVKGMKSLSPVERAIKMTQLSQKTYEAQDYAMAAGKYWTKKTKEILLEDAAQSLKNVSDDPKKAYNEILDLVKEKKLPESVLKKVNEKAVANVLSGDYDLKTLRRSDKNFTDDYKDLLLKGTMDLPLDSIELGDDIVSVLGYPQITNRAPSKEFLGASRYELFKKGDPQLKPEYEKIYKKTESMYLKEMSTLANEVMNKVNSEMHEDNKLFKDSEATEFGQYVLPLVGQDIAKFAIIKALNPKAEVRVNKETGEISYDYNKLKKFSLQEAGIITKNPEDTASALISKIKHGIANISDHDKKIITESIIKRIKDTNANSFMLSEMILDRTQAGLDWRIDAAKDIADIDSLKNGNSEFTRTWDDAVDFWRHFSKAVHKENPNSYMAAEVTDEGDLRGLDRTGSRGRYTDNGAVVNKLINEAGMNTTANYRYLFSGISKIFGKEGEKAEGIGDRNGQLRKLLIGDGEDYLNAAPLDSINYSYTFAGNHDKPRMLHVLATDMELFHSKFHSDDHKQRALAILWNKMPDEIKPHELGSNFDKISGKSIAMAELVKGSMVDALKTASNGDKKNPKRIFDDSRIQELHGKIGAAVADLAKGRYLDTTFSSEAFGAKPFDKVIDMVIKQAEEKHDLKISDDEKKALINQTFKLMVEPAMSKLEGLMSFLVALPGNPTLFAGDDLGLTGYEEKCKNIHLQNRGCLNWDLLDDKNKDFINKFYTKINDTMALRSKKELEPLNTGAPYLLKEQKDNVTALLRQNADGAMTISLFNANGTTYDHKKGLSKHTVSLNHIELGTQEDSNSKDGLKGGLPAGTQFRSSNSDDKCIYKVSDDGYSIKKYASNGKDLQDDGKIEFDDPTMILYYEPVKKNVSFTGRKVLYNPQYNFVSNPYKTQNIPMLGSKLSAQSAV